LFHEKGRSFSLLAPKENEPKEMRFAAAQIPSKIGAPSLNGENLHRFTLFRAASDSSPFFTLARTDFFTPPFARRRFTDTATHSSRISEKCTLSNPRQANKVSAVWGGETPHRKPRHDDRNRKYI
jgi:hypothetical protein